MEDMNKIKKLAIDVYEGKVEKFSQEQGEEALRQALIDVIGCMPTDKKKFRRAFNKHKDEFFEIVEELITVTVNRLAMESFGEFVDVKNTDLGVKPIFTIDNPDLYKVSIVATGLNTLRRQRIYGKRVETQAFRLGVAVYDEFFDFITGRRDWTKTVDKVAESFNYEIATRISKALFSGYEMVTAKGLGVSSTYSDDALFELVKKVEGVLNTKCAIYGTATALDKIEGAKGDADKLDERNYGFVKVFKGRACIELPQVYDLDAKAFVVPDDTFIIAPVGTKIVHLGFEGDAVVLENTDPTAREDMQVEYSFLQMVHIGIVVASQFGMFKISK